jgi:hypothetical protein
MAAEKLVCFLLKKFKNFFGRTTQVGGVDAYMQSRQEVMQR